MLRELSRHSSVERIDMCEIDKMVVEVSFGQIRWFSLYLFIFSPGEHDLRLRTLVILVIICSS